MQGEGIQSYNISKIFPLLQKKSSSYEKHSKQTKNWLQKLGLKNGKTLTN
jgi:hypothetical protein